MAESKSAALPLGDAPTPRRRGPTRAIPLKPAARRGNSPAGGQTDIAPAVAAAAFRAAMFLA